MNRPEASTAERFEVRSADGTMIPVFKSGRGPPLVLVHGAGPGHLVWEAVRPTLEPHCTVLAIERRNNSVDPWIRYDLRREFEDVAAVANAQRGDVDVVGQSSGAVCALGASLLISRLRRLVLYEPPMLSMTPSNIDNMQALVDAGDLSGAAESFMRDSVKVAPETIAAMKASPSWAERQQRAPYMIREEAVLRAWTPRLDEFAGLTSPVLLLMGERTPAGHHHRGYVDFLEPWVRNLRVDEIPGQEHAAHNADPETFARIVLEFLDGAERTSK